MNKSILLRYMSIVLLSFVIGCSTTVAENTLTEAEKNEGWELLFDGKDMSKWRNFKADDINPKWIIEDGCMTLTGKGGGDIMTKKKYKNFDLKLDWKISIAGNSGIFIFGTFVFSGGKVISYRPRSIDISA